VQNVYQRSTTVYVCMQGRCFLAFCTECTNFVAASAKLGRIAVATRAHQCKLEPSRKLSLKADPAKAWLRASGAMA
jgi:hypothetical protein